MKFFDVTPLGQIMNRLSEDLYNIDAELPFVFDIFIENFIESIAYPIGLAIAFPWVAILIVVIFCAF